MAYQVGQAFEPFEFIVEQAKVDELCHALHDDNPIYQRSPGAATPVAVPPTFLNSSIQTFVTGQNPVDVLGISRRRALHAGQAYEYLAAIHVGDVLTGRTVLTEVVEKTGRSGTIRFLTLETRFVRAGNDVAIVRNKVAERVVSEPTSAPAAS